MQSVGVVCSNCAQVNYGARETCLACGSMLLPQARPLEQSDAVGWASIQMDERRGIGMETSSETEETLSAWAQRLNVGSESRWVTAGVLMYYLGFLIPPIAVFLWMAQCTGSCGLGGPGTCGFARVTCDVDFLPLVAISSLVAVVVVGVGALLSGRWPNVRH